MTSLVLETNKRKSITPYEVYKKYNWEELHPGGSPRTPLTCAKLASTFRNPKPCNMTIENMCDTPSTLSTAYLQEVKTTGDFQCHNCYNYKEIHKVYDKKDSDVEIETHTTRNCSFSLFDHQVRYYEEKATRVKQQSGLILRTIYCQFGNWCVRKNYCVGNNKVTKLFWFKHIVSFLCYEDSCLAVLRGHEAAVLSVAKLNETTIVSASSDATIRVWDLRSSSCVAVLRGHKKSASACNFAMSVAILNETKIVSGSSDATIRVWDLASNSCIAVLEGHECGVTCVAKLNETKIVSGSEDVTIRVWDLASHSCIAVLNGPDQEIRRLVVLNETKVISYGVTYDQGYDDPKVAIWDLTSHSWAGLPNYENAPNYGHAPFAKFNETTIICAGRCGIYLWDLPSDSCVAALRGHSARINTVAKVDETTIISGSGIRRENDNTIRVWDLDSRSCVAVFRRHTNWILSVAKLNETIIFSGSLDKTIRVWDLEIAKRNEKRTQKK